MAITDDLQAWWDMEEDGDANRLDATDNSNDLSVSDAGVWGRDTGKQGYAADCELHGYSLGITGGTGLDLQNDWTIAGWLYGSDAGSNSMYFPIRTYCEMVLINTDGTLEFHTWEIGSPLHWTGAHIMTTTITADWGAWHFIVATYNGTTKDKTIRIDDSASETDTADHTDLLRAPGATPLRFLTQQNLEHRIDSIGIWDRVLDASEITFLYNGGTGRTYSDLEGQQIPGSVQGPGAAVSGSPGRVLGTSAAATGPGAALSSSMTRIDAPTIRGRQVFSRTRLSRYFDQEDFEPERLDR